MAGTKEPGIVTPLAPLPLATCCRDTLSSYVRLAVNRLTADPEFAPPVVEEKAKKRKSE